MVINKDFIINILCQVDELFIYIKCQDPFIFTINIEFDGYSGYNICDIEYYLKDKSNKDNKFKIILKHKDNNNLDISFFIFEKDQLNLYKLLYSRYHLILISRKDTLNKLL